MRPAKSSSLGVCGSVFAGLHPSHHQLASGGVRIAERELGLLVSGDRRHERQGRQAPPRDLQLGLEDAGYEPAARCLSDELGAWVVQLRNPLRHRERSRSTNFLERSLGEVRERRPPLAGDEGVSGENDRAAGASDALGERSVARAPSSERGGSGWRARR